MNSEKFVSFHEIKYYFKVKDHSWQCWTFGDKECSLHLHMTLMKHGIP